MPTSFQSFNPGDLIEDTHVEQFIEPIQNLESGKPWYGDDTGTINAFKMDLDPAPTAYTQGMLVRFKANNSVTGPATINVNSLGVKFVLKEDGASLITGDILSGQMVSAIYNGAEFQMVSPVMNPSFTPTAPTTNTLVYHEVTKENPGTSVTINLPSFIFNPAKSYLMEIQIHPTNVASEVRVTLSDGANTYAYPSSTTSITGPYIGLAGLHSKQLPTLSGSHTVSVTGTYFGYVQVQLFEINDNLVYADFTPSEQTGTVTTHTLTGFTALSGHTYLLTTRVSNYHTVSFGVASYLTDGTNSYGVPSADPLGTLMSGYYTNSRFEVSRILTGLSGAYNVKVRGKYHNGVTVLLRDIT